MKDWSDAEVIMVAVTLNSGAVVKGDDPEHADRLNALLFETVQAELQRRELHPNSYLRLLVARLLDGLQKDQVTKKEEPNPDA